MTRRSLSHKLLWRLRFLVDPGGFARGEPFSAGEDPAPIRDVLLEAAASLPLRDRLAFVGPRPPRRDLMELLLLARRRGIGRDEHFDLGDRRIFFRPDHPVPDPHAYLEGILLILKEAYGRPSPFFSPEVRVESGDTVFDVGGNLGTSALLFSRLAGPDGRVVSFEPIFHNLLRRNAEANGASDVRVVAAGVAESSGEAEFALSDRGVDSRMSGPRFAGGRKITAPLITLDGFVEREGLDRVDFVKMDIEGAEESALLGATETLRRLRPRLSIASYHTDPEGRAQHPRLVRLLGRLGYEVREVEGRHIYAW